MPANVISNGLNLELEPSIGNHNEDFLAKWNEKLNKFSPELTADVTGFCGKTINGTDAETENTNKELTGQTNLVQHNDITATLNDNQQTRKNNTKTPKDTRYYNLKCNIRNKPHRPQTNWYSDEDRNNNQNQQNNIFYKQSNNRNQQNYASVTRRNISNTNLSSRPNYRRNSNTMALSTTGQVNVHVIFAFCHAKHLTLLDITTTFACKFSASS